MVGVGEDTSFTPEGTLINVAGPASLFPIERREHFAPTKEQFVEWSTMSGYPLAKVEAAWSIPGVKESWGYIQQTRVMRTFLVEYRNREEDRYKDGESSVPLWNELGIYTSWFEMQGIGEEASRLIRNYEEAVVEQIWLAGDISPDLDDAEDRWELYHLLDTENAVHSGQIISDALNPKGS